MTQTPEDIVEEYMAAYRAANGKDVSVVKRLGGWYRVNGRASHRLRDLKSMAGNLRFRIAQEKTKK